MSEEHKESLESPRKPRQILTDPAKSSQLQPANELSVASADPGPALTQRQQLALVALLSAHSVAAAARRSGVGERSIHRWLRDGFSDVGGSQRADLSSQNQCRGSARPTSR